MTNKPAASIGLVPAGRSEDLSAEDHEYNSSASTTPEMMAMEVREANKVSKKRTAIVISCITYSTGITTFLVGVVTMAIPAITADLQLPSNLVLWPVTVYSLTCGCTLLICGSVADVAGNWLMFLLGCFLQGMSTLACGLARTGTQMIVFRAFSGVAASFCLPSAVSLINEVFLPGTIGWKWGFFIAAISNFLMLIVCAWQLPKTYKDPAASNILQHLASDIDWVGVALASAALAIISYTLAALTGSPSAIRLPQNITLLVLAAVLLIAFVLWVGRQERLNRPALIPNSLWKNKVFSCICINVFCIWAAFNAFEQYQNFFFQEVQHVSPLGAAVRFLPAPIAGALTNVVVGLSVHRVRADWIVIMATIPCALASLLMAVAQPRWSYWACAFLANFLNPIRADGIFIVSNLLYYNYYYLPFRYSSS
ncbi:hypothetical protein Asppvi_003778 [Aspergillus pseudoviridinutans]|uniref:MFS general substrate transporter n=1 Tax=Aspergillus pseudoviridinutans TaxID=1517512 RepID=A0A9P3ETC9_9EURO|nr:uncharacterized protein Asppvi_003778 [Aspergillus pseudoviridinutans]GIJ84923.1 hypothetical protein Asppvi_003778 [Aspergillus pseudoviridinutans]